MLCGCPAECKEWRGRGGAILRWCLCKHNCVCVGARVCVYVCVLCVYVCDVLYVMCCLCVLCAWFVCYEVRNVCVCTCL